MTTLLILLAAGLITWVLRVTFIVLLPAKDLPKSVRTTLEAAAPAALAALLATDLVHQGITEPAVVPALLAGTIAAAVVTWKWSNLALTALAGLAAFGGAAALL